MAVDPATLRIVHHPADILRAKADPLGEVTDEIRAVAARMVELMREAEGIGLAAPQVGLPWRLFVCHVPPGDDGETIPPTSNAEPEFYIDPVLLDPSKNLARASEGCLSLPDINGDVIRPETISIEYTDFEGQRRTSRASGLLARCWQHETDHLDGVLIIDRMTQPSRLKNRAALRALERVAGAG